MPNTKTQTKLAKEKFFTNSCLFLNNPMFYAKKRILGSEQAYKLTKRKANNLKPHVNDLVIFPTT